MKRLSLIALVLLAFFMLAWVLVQAQDPTGEVGEQIDDLTPLRVEPADQADDSNDRRIPEAYIQATGGPDAFGYTYIDSDGDGCTYDWIEIETTGTDLELIGDNMGAALPIGFSFPFCENSFTVISATTNGYLTFGPDLTDSTDDAIPSIIDPNDLIAVFWDDQEIDQIEGDAVYYQLFGTPGSQYVVVEFLIRDRYGSAPYRYEAVLYGNGDLKFQYNEMTTDLDGDGTSAAVGIENSRGTVGLGYMYHLNPAGNDIHNGLAVCIHYPDNVYLSPGWQAGYGTEEQVVSYDLLALNQTGATREFDLAAEDFAWPTAVTPTQTTIPAGETVSVTVAVTIPSGTVGLTDTATIRVSAVLDPAVYSDTAQVETTALSGLYGFTGASATDEAAVFDQQLHIMFQRLDLLPEGDYPYDATMTPDGSEVWTPGASGDGVVVIDTTSGTVSQRIAVGDYPIGVAFRKDSAYGFVSNRNTNDVSVIDATSYTVVDSIPIDAAYDPGNLAANPCASEIYMVDWYDDGLLVLDADTFAVTQVLTEVGQSLWQLVTNPLGDRLYVTDRGQDVVHVLDTATLSETATIPVGDDPWGIDITPDGSLIYVANEDSHDVTAIDTTNNSVIVTIALPHDDAKPRDVDFSANGAYAYVTSGDVGSTRVHDEVYVIDTATHTVVHRIDVDPARNTNVVAVAPQMSSCLGLFADKRAAPEPVVLGDPLTYTVRYGYAGLVPATGVLVTDSLPGGTAYLTSTGGLSSTYDPIDHRVLWDLGTVPVGERGVLTARLQPVDKALVGQTITNEAYLDFTSFATFRLRCGSPTPWSPLNWSSVTPTAAHHLIRCFSVRGLRSPWRGSATGPARWIMPGNWAMGRPPAHP